MVEDVERKEKISHKIIFKEEKLVDLQTH